MNDLLDRFARSLNPADTGILEDVRDYVEWQTGHQVDFTPSGLDDVAVRTYLLDLRISGKVDRETLAKKIASLKRFYNWALAETSISTTPFAEFNFDRPILSRDQIRRRLNSSAGSPEERELARLHALNRLAGQLNRAADVQSALDSALETLVDIMGLQTAWVTLMRDAGFKPRDGTLSPPHGFALAAAYGLPPALEHDNRHHLRRPPVCHCQSLLRAGRLRSAVNVVECSRLKTAGSEDGDTKGLLFHATVPIISHERPLGLINVATAEWQLFTATDLQLLSVVGAQVAVALERAHLYDLAEAHRARMNSELEMARAVQTSLLPGRLPDIPGFRLAVNWRPVLELAGDLYNIFQLPDGRWAIVVADVSGKGAAAAFYMVLVQSLIRAKAEQTQSPAEALAQVNRALIAQSRTTMYVTVFYAILDTATGTFTYSNAGHYPPMVRRFSRPDKCEVLPLGGLILGMFEEVSLCDATFTLAPGDTLVIYTDGVTDAENRREEDYGSNRFADAITTAPADAQALLTHILTDVAAFTGSHPQLDDMTLFVVSREP